MDLEQQDADHSTTEIAELHLVVASQREVIARLQHDRDADEARIDTLTRELTRVLRSG